MHNDPELLRLYADQGSETAFGELVQRHLAAVYAVALRRVGGDAHLAQEVSQSVFTDLARKAGPLSRRDSVVGWLFLAARFAAGKAVRRDRRQREVAERAAVMGAATPAVTEDWSELRPLLDEAVQELGEREREAVLLHFYGQRTYREIGAMLHLTENGARMRVERALEKLRDALGRRGIGSTAAALAGALETQAAAALPAGVASVVTAAAVASAAAVPAAGLSLLLMTITRTQLAVALALTAAGTAFIGVTQQQKISALQQQLAASTAAREKQVGDLTRRLGDQGAQLAQLRSEAKSKAGSGSGISSVGADSGVKLVHERDVLRDHPEYAALSAKQYRRQTFKAYARAIAALKLAPEKAARLKELLVEREQSAYDANIAAAAQGIVSGSKEENQAIAAATKDSKQEILAMVGAAGVDKLEALKTQDHNTGSPAEEAEADMEDAGVGATADQTTALALMLHDLGDSAQNAAAGNPGFRDPDPATWLSPFDEQVISQAATLLSPEQVRIYAASRKTENQTFAIMRQYWGNGPGMMVP